MDSLCEGGDAALPKLLWYFLFILWFHEVD